jgi:hypothetical protein
VTRLDDHLFPGTALKHVNETQTAHGALDWLRNVADHGP